jgi:hypothetical protein
MPRATALAILTVVLAAAEASGARGRREELLRVVTPIAKSTATAHPFVNLRVGFSADADLETFRARLGGTDVTGLFSPVTQNGETFLHAEVEPPLVRLGRRNRLRLEVRSARSEGKGGRAGRRVRDVDRLRFRALSAPNQPPTAVLVPVGSSAGVDAIIPGVPFAFRGEASDPEFDRLVFSWEFGDSEVSSEQTPPPHDYPASANEFTPRFTVSDGQTQASDTRTIVVCPGPMEGRTAGLLRVEGTERLEFGSVPPGLSATRALMVRNTSSDPLSLLTGRVATDGATFAASPSTFALGPGESTPVTVTFAPTGEGHQWAEVVAVASATNSCVAHLLAHGYAGAAPDTGPTFAAEPVFYTDAPPGIPGVGTFGIAPSGARFYVDNTVHVCSTTFDYCLSDRDCVSGGTCLVSATCVRGERAGEPCTKITDCPGGFCPAQTDFEVLDMCSDGQGSLFLMSDEGTFTDVTPGDTELSGSLLRISFEPDGTRTGAQILNRVTTQTVQLACDRLPAANGRVYLAEFRETPGTAACFRDGREALTGVRKTSGVKAVVPGWERIDAAEGFDQCNDDVDQAEDLQVSADGGTVYASLPSGGLYRILPSPLFITPDVSDYFQLHPDGSIIVARTSDQGPTGLVRIYKIFPEQALHGAVRLNDLSPCATLRVPNNRGQSTNATRSFTVIDYPFAVGRAASGGNDGIILVSFVTTGGTNRDAPDREPLLASLLRVQGTAAFHSPDGASTCSFLGFINTDLLDQLTF